MAEVFQESKKLSLSGDTVITTSLKKAQDTASALEIMGYEPAIHCKPRQNELVD